MTNREEYIAQLKVRLERCNAAIARLAGAGGTPAAALREARDRVLGKLRAFESRPAVPQRGARAGR